GDRREVDDRAVAARLQMWVCRLRDRDGADDVDVERGEPVGARRREAVVEVRAGEVDEPVETAEPRDDGLDKGGELVVRGGVRVPEERALAELGCERLPGGVVDVGDRDGHSSPVQLPDDGAPDQRRAARDDRAPALEAVHRNLREKVVAAPLYDVVG